MDKESNGSTEHPRPAMGYASLVWWILGLSFPEAGAPVLRYSHVRPSLAQVRACHGSG